MTLHRRFNFYPKKGETPEIVCLPIYYNDDLIARAFSILKDLRPSSYWEEIVETKEQEVPSK